MIDDKKIVTVINKSGGRVAYELPEFNNLHRTYGIGESKKVPYGEIRALSYTKGGMVLLKEYLTILDEEAVEELIGNVEPEYYYTRKEVEDLLKFGTLDQLEDCLNFAPEGILEMVKSAAIEMKLNAVDKRKMIGDKFGINLDRSIEILMEDEAENAPVQPAVRKATAKAASVENKPTGAVRKAAAVKIVSPKEEA